MSSKMLHRRPSADCQLDETLESNDFIPKNQDLGRPYFVAPPTAATAVPSNDVLCGLGSWRPAFLQGFAKLSVFFSVFCVSMMFLGMPNAYFYAISSTIEKVFNINSKVTGVILIGNDVSQVLFSIAIGYFGSKGSRPSWMALGLAMCAVSCFMYAANHCLWAGPSKATFGNSTELDQTGPASDLCWAGNQTSSSMFYDSRNECPKEKPINYRPVVVFFLGQFAAGIGNTALMSLGISYGDDYSKKKNAPLMFGVMIMSRMLGAFMGFIVAGICLRMYVVPGENPHFSQSDPRWLGRWWLGFVGFGVCLTVCSFLMWLLPRKMPPKVQESAKDVVAEKLTKLEEIDEESEQDITKMAIKDLIQTICRLLRNPVVVLNILAESVLILYIGASQIYSSRYTEVQFRQTASKASFLTGIFSICVMLAACIGGSVLFSKLRPSASQVSAVSTVLRFVQVLLIVGQMMLSCGKVDYANVRVGDNQFEVTSGCSQMCECSDNFQPVCIGNTTYLSPCHAGCSGYRVEGSKKIFNDCTCALSASTIDVDNLDQLNTSSSVFPTAVSGVCSSKTCSAMKYYLALSSIINVLTAAMYPACATILIRCVRKADKSMVMALKTIGFCLIGFFPGPVLYGFVFDSACLLRESGKCTGRDGNCWVYDIDLLRQRFLGTSATVVTISAVFSFFLYLQVRKRIILLFDDDDVNKTTGYKANGDEVGKEMKPLNEC